MSQYGKAEYWEERYTRDPEPFDWYQRFTGIKDLVQGCFTPESKLLNVGAGNSRLSEEMFDEGYQNITTQTPSFIQIFLKLFGMTLAFHLCFPHKFFTLGQIQNSFLHFDYLPLIINFQFNFVVQYHYLFILYYKLLLLCCTNIDISHVVTKAMQEKYKDKGPNFKYLHMDARAMEFEDGSFDGAIDKGTLDAILCGESSSSNAQKVIQEVHRVLGPKGVYFAISYGLPEHRLQYLEKPEYDWNVIVKQVHKPTISTSIAITNEDKDAPNVHYIYICTKGQQKGAKQ